jgi:pimeloyl-ACP methyl ester carboxylesterase
MPRAALDSGIELEYVIDGPDDAPTLLLVMGFTAQLIAWRDGFVDELVRNGLRVIRFDNRDCGLSSKLDGQLANPMVVLDAVLKGEQLPAVPYTLSDMAADAVGLLDHLGIGSAHIAGASMSGMIVQTMAIEHPTRVASLTSIMSSTGDPRSGAPTDEARAALLAPPPPDRAAFIDASTRAEVWMSNRYYDEEETRAMAARSYDRSFYPEGALRQLAAIYASGDRSDSIGRLDTPTLVIHGTDDTLITPSGGAHTADVVPGSSYLLVSDMGHDLPAPLWPWLAGAIAAHVAAA